MPSKLRKAIGAVKDKTSIGIAKVSTSGSSNVEVAILKATRHDEAPINERYVREILFLIASDRAYAAACAQVLAKRIGKTRTWIVALKSLMLILRIFQDGDLHFPKEVLHATKRGAKILNLSSFRDDSNSSPWDYTAFVRAFALYLDERLECFLTGKLLRRFTKKDKDEKERITSGNSRTIFDPASLVDKFSAWQKLLDRAMAMRPTGAARTNRLVQFCLCAVVQESFDLYRDISEGLTLLLDSFFTMKHQSCVNAYQVCVKASRQFEELSLFYYLCKSIGIGRTSEYPSVQKVPEELIETLQEFLKDQSSFSATKSPPRLLHCAGKDLSPCFEREESYTRSPEPASTERGSDRGSEFGSQCTSLEDLMRATDLEMSTVLPMDRFLAQFEKPSNNGDELFSYADAESSPLSGTLSTSNNTFDLWALDEWPPSEDQEVTRQDKGETDAWEKELAEAVSASQSVQTSANASPDGLEPSVLNSLFDSLDLYSPSPPFDPQRTSTNSEVEQAPSMSEHHYNPFLQNDDNVSPTATSNNQLVLHPIMNSISETTVAPTFQAARTFSTQNPSKATNDFDNNDPFAALSETTSPNRASGSSNQQNLTQQQQAWLQNQEKIIAKNASLMFYSQQREASGNF